MFMGGRRLNSFSPSGREGWGEGVLPGYDVQTPYPPNSSRTACAWPLGLTLVYDLTTRPFSSATTVDRTGPDLTSPWTFLGVPGSQVLQQPGFGIGQDGIAQAQLGGGTSGGWGPNHGSARPR